MTRFEPCSAHDRHDELWRAIHAWPKIDLHRHLEGSLRLATLLDIAHEYQIPVPAEDLEQLRPHVQMVEADDASVSIFMGKFRALRHFFRSPEIIRRVTFEAVEDAAADNVRHLELRFTPHALARHHNASYEEVIACVCDAAAHAGQQFQIGVRLIISVNRHESLAIAAQTVAAGARFVGHGIVGLDLAGLEAGHSALPFQPVFEQARAAGLALTVHAGEWDGPHNIREAVARIGTDRIGHGVRIVEDDRVLALVRAADVPLELCPTSNLQTGAVRRLEEYPLKQLFEQGVCVTVNTDDPALSNITLTDELVLCHTRLGLPLDALKAILLNAARATFLPVDERRALVDELQAALALR